MSLAMVLSVAAGGAFGAAGRFLMMSAIGHWLGHGFPFATLAVNVLGAVVMGGLVETMALVWSPGEQLRAFLVVGVLGGFTTFSTFSLDLYTLLVRGDIGPALAYAVASVVICLLGFYLGLVALRHVLA